MKNKSKILISIISFLLLSVILFFSIYSPFYMRLFFYGTAVEDLDLYFADIVCDTQAMLERTVEARENGATVPLDMPDVLVSLAKYDYTYLNEETAANIIKHKSEIKDIHQVNTFVYSDISKPLVVSNIVYFEFEQSIYAQIFYEDSNFNGSADCVAFFSVNTNEMPPFLNDEAYRDYGLSENYFNDTAKEAAKYALLCSLLFSFIAFSVVCLIIALFSKNKKRLLKHR